MTTSALVAGDGGGRRLGGMIVPRSPEWCGVDALFDGSVPSGSAAKALGIWLSGSLPTSDGATETELNESTPS